MLGRIVIAQNKAEYLPEYLPDDHDVEKKKWTDAGHDHLTRFWCKRVKKEKSRQIVIDVMKASETDTDWCGTWRLVR